MNLTIPELSLVVLIGPSGSGKSTFAAKHFLSTEVISSAACRALVSDDDNDLASTAAAFRVLHSIAGDPFRYGRLVVLDAPSVQPASRNPVLARPPPSASPIPPPLPPFPSPSPCSPAITRLRRPRRPPRRTGSSSAVARRSAVTITARTGWTPSRVKTCATTPVSSA